MGLSRASIPAILVHEDVRVCEDLATLSNQESRALYSGTNHVTDRLSELRDLSSGQAKFRAFDTQQPSRINPLAVTVLAPTRLTCLRTPPDSNSVAVSEPNPVARAAIQAKIGLAFLDFMPKRLQKNTATISGAA